MFFTYVVMLYFCEINKLLVPIASCPNLAHQEQQLQPAEVGCLLIAGRGREDVLSTTLSRLN